LVPQFDSPFSISAKAAVQRRWPFLAGAERGRLLRRSVANPLRKLPLGKVARLFDGIRGTRSEGQMLILPQLADPVKPTRPISTTWVLPNANRLYGSPMGRGKSGRRQRFLTMA
jgi:hypothetical protein